MEDADLKKLLQKVKDDISHSEDNNNPFFPLIFFIDQIIDNLKSGGAENARSYTMIGVDKNATYKISLDFEETHNLFTSDLSKKLKSFRVEISKN